MRRLLLIAGLCLAPLAAQAQSNIPNPLPVTQALAPWTINVTQVGGASLAFGSALSAASIPVVIASDQAAVAIKQATAANLNATVVGTGTFATQAAITAASGAVASGAYASGSVSAGAIVDLGTGASPGANTTNGFLKAINTTLGSPFQAGGSIGNTSFAATQSGTWNIGTVTTLPSIPAGSNTIGAVTPALNTSGGWTPKLGNGLSTTVLSIKGSAGQLGGLQCYNPNSSQVYVQIFNIASGSVTLGSSTPLLSIAIAATSTGGWASPFPGFQFGTAISAAATTTATGSTAPSTAADCNFAYN